jgi:hypothetical protein
MKAGTSKEYAEIPYMHAVVEAFDIDKFREIETKLQLKLAKIFIDMSRCVPCAVSALDMLLQVMCAGMESMKTAGKRKLDAEYQHEYEDFRRKMYKLSKKIFNGMNLGGTPTGSCSEKQQEQRAQGSRTGFRMLAHFFMEMWRQNCREDHARTTLAFVEADCKLPRLKAFLRGNESSMELRCESAEAAELIVSENLRVKLCQKFLVKTSIAESEEGATLHIEKDLCEERAKLLREHKEDTALVDRIVACFPDIEK